MLLHGGSGELMGRVDPSCVVGSVAVGDAVGSWGGLGPGALVSLFTVGFRWVCGVAHLLMGASA